VDEIDEYGPSKDNTLGHKFVWKVPSDYDHWDFDGRIVKAVYSLNEKILPDLGTAISTSGMTATLGYVLSFHIIRGEYVKMMITDSIRRNHNVQSCITTLVSFRTKMQFEELVATEYLPFVVSMCKSDNAMLMTQAVPAPGQLRSMRRRCSAAFVADNSRAELSDGKSLTASVACFRSYHWQGLTFEI
jgi:hypothetical protein